MPIDFFGKVRGENEFSVVAPLNCRIADLNKAVIYDSLFFFFTGVFIKSKSRCTNFHIQDNIKKVKSVKPNDERMPSDTLLCGASLDCNVPSVVVVDLAIVIHLHKNENNNY